MSSENGRLSLIFDYHDDVVVFDSSVKAKHADFYQVKTAAKPHWNFGEVIKRKKNGNSIIGKIYFKSQRTELLIGAFYKLQEVIYKVS